MAAATVTDTDTDMHMQMDTDMDLDAAAQEEDIDQNHPTEPADVISDLYNALKLGDDGDLSVIAKVSGDINDLLDQFECGYGLANGPMAVVLYSSNACTIVNLSRSLHGFHVGKKLALLLMCVSPNRVLCAFVLNTVVSTCKVCFEEIHDDQARAECEQCQTDLHCACASSNSEQAGVLCTACRENETEAAIDGDSDVDSDDDN